MNIKTNYSRFNLILACLAMAVVATTQSEAQISEQNYEEVINSITADSLRGHLSFIASDLLKGRDTPSPGLDIAAEYIAAQFRRAGLEPVGDDGYFQTGEATKRARDDNSFICTISNNETTISLNASAVSLYLSPPSVSITNSPIVWIDFEDENNFADIQDNQLADSVILAAIPNLRSVAPEYRAKVFGNFQRFAKGVGKSGAKLVLSIEGDSTSGTGINNSMSGRRMGFSNAAVLRIHQSDAAILLNEVSVGNAKASVSLNIPMQTQTQVPARNVVGLLKGSDAELAETYIIVTGHYDHLGTGQPVDGDEIYNGANDDGSGTVSVIELASALSKLKTRPRRSILFMCVFGEERGLLGSRHYVENPIFPLKQTIANVNLEHIGRTDDMEGSTEGKIMPTGYDFSSLVSFFEEGAKQTGIEIYHHPRNSASFFGRSDNVAFAAKGIPAHTFCTAFIFPDYHQPGDHWDKINYNNMAKLDKMIALGLINLANSDEVPAWNEEIKGTGRYIESWKKLHGIKEAVGNGD